MTNNLLSLLAVLSRIAPDVCQHEVNDIYFIGGYRFFMANDGEFSAAVPSVNCIFVGTPARAWLRDAVEREIARRGWPYMIQYHEQRNQYAVWVGFNEKAESLSDNAIEALLTALIMALKGE